MAELPTGTVTFLFTDLEGSTRLWEEQPDAMRAALARHDEILVRAVEAQGGRVVKGTGDGMHAVFPTPDTAIAAALGAQQRLAAESWGPTGPLRVRMGLHTGVAERRGVDYFGPVLNRAARLMALAHPDQVLCSQATADLVRDSLPVGVDLVDLGSHILRGLGRREVVFQVTHADLRADFPPLAAATGVPGNLPRQMTSFVGHDQDLSAIAAELEQSPVVTLTGVGGVGKTRLALEVAGAAAPAHRDGAWLCEFASVTDPGALWETIAASLRVQPFTGRSLEESVLEYLAAKRLVLVLDNCEHLLAPIADVVEAITQRCPRVAVLATSREGLGLPGERIVAVRSLAVPSEDADLKVLRAGEAVQLFCDRAIAAKSDFTMNDRDAAAVAVLCRRLDGIPLAIELAAARVRSLSPEDLVARLDRRFRLLTRGSRAALERHQTLRSTIDWSYDLLEPREREALARLSVFAGGCDLAAAEAVLADDTLDVFDVVDVLGQLVDKSLVVADRTGEAGPVRYRLLETVRQYAQERLEASGRTETVRGCHAEHYVALAEAAGPHLRSRDQLEWADRVVQETDNFRAVLDWAIETPSPGHALRLIAPFSIVTGMTIGDAAHEWAETACTIPGVEAHPSFPVVAAWASYGATMRRDFDRAEARVTAAEQGQSTLGGPEQAVLRARCVLEFYRGSSERLQPQTQAWLDIARSSGDPYWIASALLMRAGVLAGTDEATATAMVEEAVRLARAAGTVSVLPIALSFLGGLLPIEEVERKRALFSESIEAGTRVGDRMSVAMSSAALGLMAADVGDWRTALRATADAAEQRLHIGDLANLYLSFDAAGVAFAVLGHSEPAAVLITTSDVMNAYRDNYFFLWADMIASISATARETLGERQFEALTQPDTIDLAEIVEYLRSQTERVLADEHADPPSRDAIA